MRWAVVDGEEDQIEKFRSEQFAWETMARVDSIVTPRVIAVETDEAILPYPFLIMTHVPGTPMGEVFPTLSQGEQLRLLEELGAVVRDIHALSVDLAALPDGAARWEGHGDCLHRDVRELSTHDLISTRARDRLERLLAAHSSRLAAMDNDIVFLHGDVHFGNILLQQNQGHWHIAGLVDAELAGIGPRGRELRALEPYSLRGLAVPGMRDAFLRGYGKGYAGDDYKLAYLTAELEPDNPNKALLRTIEATDSTDDLDWIDIFGEAHVERKRAIGH